MNRRQMISGGAALISMLEARGFAGPLFGGGGVDATQRMYTSPARINARKALRDFAIDGNPDARNWVHAEWTSFDRSADGKTRYPDSATRAALLWSPESLYVGFRCRYRTLNTYQDEDVSVERWELWKRDVVEIFVNPQPERLNHYYEFEVAPNNQWIDLEIDLSKPPPHDPSWNSGFRHATQVDSKRRVWSCEMCIPIHSTGALPPSPGTEWRLNMFRADGSGEDRRELAWSSIPNGTTFHVPARFGLLRLVD